MIAEAPKWLIAKTNRFSVRQNANRPVCELDLAVNIKYAIQFLRITAPALQGNGGDEWTYLTACRVKDLGISQALALELMLDHWNYRCEPRWEIDDLRKKISNAYSYGANPPGVSTPQAIFGVKSE